MYFWFSHFIEDVSVRTESYKIYLFLSHDIKVTGTGGLTGTVDGVELSPCLTLIKDQKITLLFNVKEGEGRDNLTLLKPGLKCRPTSFTWTLDPKLCRGV